VTPGTEQTTQRRGNRRSSSTWEHATARDVTCLCQKSTERVTSRHGDASAAAAEEAAVSLGSERPEPSRVELVGTVGRP
jgi:hypothetical protein